MNFLKKIFRKSNNDKLDKSLEKTSSSFIEKIKKVVVGKTKVDATTLDDLEEVLITSDVGVKTTLKIIDSIEERVKKEKYTNAQELDTILKEEISNIIFDNSDSDAYEIKEKPHVILVVGVNGVGKTTSIGKLANFFKNQGLSVMIGAADTFRAAAIEQLEEWAIRSNVDIVKQEMGSDPASVSYDTLNSAINKNHDIVIIDTAGRLHNKVNLMNELSKIGRVLKKLNINAPHEILLVLDGSTGQNAYEQAKQFSEATEITSMMVTKLDGTAKGGVVIGISDQLSIPIKFIGTGESIDDIEIFDKKQFVESFFKKKIK
ncbi:MAG: signal recognition particle-docking protein FtsY [Flavobacteriaceae bacterium]|nr:MAG: signal recognition particle-docking protein FtsY [Flavobacteriales bacterium]